jgi:alpha-tubulin suppressor-like RCC1 family protein
MRGVRPPVFVMIVAVIALSYVGSCGDAPTEPTGGMRMSQIDAGYLHTCGLDLNGHAFCWGNNDFGTLGDGSRTQRERATAASGNFTFTQLDAGAAHNCALAANGSARCWGHNDEGQLGDATFSDRSTPTPLAGNLTFVRISAGHAHSCGVTSNGAAYCWGDDSRGQLGNGVEGSTRSAVPVRVSYDGMFQQIYAGYYQSCALTSDGEAYCWGGGESGQNGDSTTQNRFEPVRVATTRRFQELAVGDRFVCGRSSGEVWCWGANRFGELGRAADDGSNIPVRVAEISSATGITASTGTSTIGGADAYACAVIGNAQLVCWGGAVAILRMRTVQPTALDAALRAGQAAAGALHLCIITLEGTAYCGGSNSAGQLGDGTTTPRSSLTAVVRPTS